MKKQSCGCFTEEELIAMHERSVREMEKRRIKTQEVINDHKTTSSKTTKRD
jgi:hypothetical protein